MDIFIAYLEVGPEKEKERLRSLLSLALSSVLTNMHKAEKLTKPM